MNPVIVIRVRAHLKDGVSCEQLVAEPKPRNWRKTLYDWLGVVAVVAVLVGFGIWMLIQFLMYQPPFRGN